MKNKILSAIMVVVASMGLATLNAFAAQSVSLTPSATEVKAGETFTVDVVLNENPGIISLHLPVESDDVLTITSVQDKGLIAPYVGQNNDLFWLNEGATADYTASGTIATLTYTVSESAAAGTYAITISTDKPNSFNYDMDEFDFGTATINIKVEADEPVVETKTVGFAASFKRTADMTGVRFTVKTSATNVASQTVTKDVAFGSTFVEAGEVKLGLQVNKVPKDVTLTATAEAY